MSEILVPSVCAALLAVFLAAVVYPLLTSRHSWLRQTGAARARLELAERKEQLYASIRELEFDLSLGKMSQHDYESLRRGLEDDAVKVLRHLDSLDGESRRAAAALAVRVEADAAALRRAGPAAQLQAPSTYAFCPGCGTRRLPAHRFCPHCGARLDVVPPPAS